MNHRPPRVLLPFSPARELRAARWPEVLISRSALSAASRAAEGLPACFHWLVLEARLTGDDQRVDMLASIVNAPGAREQVAAALADPEGLAGLEGARPLLTRWADPGRGLLAIHVLWFEWDAPFEAAVPLQLLSIDPRFWGPSDAPAPTPDEQVLLATAGHTACFGAEAPAATMACLRRAITALPRGGRAIAAATMRPRGVPRDRLFVGIPRAGVLPWLDAIGWAGDRAQVETWLPQVVAPWEPAFLQIEFADEVSGYLGIEPRQTAGLAAEYRERRRFLERLRAEGLTSAANIEAVMGWASDVIDTKGRRELRSLHMKCVLLPGQAPLVKGYLGLHFETPER
jgi:hypothetical protein